MRPRRQRCKGARAVAVALLLAAGCDRPRGQRPVEVEAAATAPVALDPRLQAMAELAFVPREAEALVRVDLADVARRSPDPAQSLKTFDFLLRAQQPAAWEVLHQAGVSLGKELGTLLLVVGNASDAFLIAGLGSFDHMRLRDALTQQAGRTKGAVEALGDDAVFTWTGADAIGAHLPPKGAPSLGDAAVGVARGLLLFGTPELVRASLAVRGRARADIRYGKLAPELLAVDTGATVWGVARSGAYLPTVLPGLEWGHFSIVLAAPGAGNDLDGIFHLRAEWASPEQAEAYRVKLSSLLATADLLGADTPLGATVSRIRKTAKLTLEGRTLVASSVP
jgi:hypothetical protein